MKTYTKIFGLLAILLLFTQCEGTSCDCEYVKYEKSNPGDQWQEVYRSDWTASCGSETLDNSVFTHWDGSKTYSRTEIECK